VAMPGMHHSQGASWIHPSEYVRWPGLRTPAVSDMVHWSELLPNAELCIPVTGKALHTGDNLGSYLACGKVSCDPICTVVATCTILVMSAMTVLSVSVDRVSVCVRVMVFGRPYYRSCLWHTMSSVVVCDVLYCGKTVRPS